MRNMMVRGYDASGNEIWRSEPVAITRQSRPSRDDYYRIDLASGTFVTLPESHLNKHYPGWQDYLVEKETS